MRARPLEDDEREALARVLERIETAAMAVAEDCGVDARAERDLRGGLAFIGFRLHGFSATKDAPVELGRDTWDS